ncbi:MULTISPECIES: hypothetical protein [Sphingomonas]|uniref:hypothetical protein n=1 Tax=Sphingomonas TaxID=13687 RepID=UPI00254D3340|nr:MULTISPECIES: hypothetical protein [Sphingomonas]MDK8187763.1 hypothetical protein [Sphingomonas zeae]MDK8217617.1 hypothetical protein [Sphingomonas sp. UMB7805-LC452B]
MPRRSPEEQVAYDSGAGRRGISYLRQNPYDAALHPAQHKAWFEGFDRTHADLGGGPVLTPFTDVAADRIEYEMVGWPARGRPWRGGA